MSTFNNTGIIKNESSLNFKPEELDIANTVEFYIYDISLLTLIYMGLALLNNLTKIEQHVPKHCILNKEGIEKRRVEHPTKLNSEQKKLRKLFLYGSFITKTATWLKAPYIFSLYNRFHGFTRPEIGFLLIVDNLTALLFGTIIGTLADEFGNKYFCILHGMLVSVHACLRLTGIKNLAYIAQFIAGICSCIFDVAFESWFINESSLLFNQNEKLLKESFRSEVLSKQVQIDGLISIFITGIGTILNIKFGIKSPFVASVFISIISSLFVFFLWKESGKEEFIKHDKMNGISEDNQRISNKPYSFSAKLFVALNEIRLNKQILNLALVDSAYRICIGQFLYIWTPLLEETHGGNTHSGSIYTLFILGRLSGSELLPTFLKFLGNNFFFLTTFINIITLTDWIAAYFVNDFVLRLYFLILYDGVSGIMDPTLALMKSTFIDHKIRSTVINLFRVPTNLCIIFLLYISQFITTFQICLIIIIFALIGLIFSIYGMYILELFKFRKKINDTLCVGIITLNFLKRLENRDFLLDNDSRLISSENTN